VVNEVFGCCKLSHSLTERTLFTKPCTAYHSGIASFLAMTWWEARLKKSAKACRKTRAMGKGPERGRIFSACLFGPFLTKKKGLGHSGYERYQAKSYTSDISLRSPLKQASRMWLMKCSSVANCRVSLPNEHYQFCHTRHACASNGG
jgi:hypothetical protein